MKEKRSMSQALNMTPEKIAFIRGNEQAIAGPFVEAPEANAHGLAKPKHLDLAQSKPHEVHPPATNQAQLEIPKISRPISTPPVKPDDRPSMLGDVLVPLTTRLRPETADALRRANLEQRLRRALPATQQEIVEEAVASWLTAHGYLA